MSDDKQEKEVFEIGRENFGDVRPYSLALEIKKLLRQIIDEGTSIDSGHGSFWPTSAEEPLSGETYADLFFTVGGVEFRLALRKSNSQFLKEGKTRKQLGLDPSPETKEPPR